MSKSHSQPLILVENARCRLGRKNIFKVDHLALHVGEKWCFFGGNGAGKSVLAALISGHRRDSPTYVNYHRGFNPRLDIHIVSFEEQQRLWEQDNRLDMSEYSEDALDRGTTVASLIQSSRTGKAPDDLLFERLIAELELKPLLEQGIRFLSSGQVRKAMIARALYAARGSVPQLLILDDPLETVDRISKQKIIDCIESNQHSGSVVIQLCRRQRDIFSFCTHLAVLDSLSLIHQGQRDLPEMTQILAGLSVKSTCSESVIAATGSLSQSDSMMPLVQLSNVNAGYGELKILERFSWRMLPGDHVLIEGPNGCGKSTLLGLIAGENHKAYGQDVKLFGKPRGSGETVWEIKSYFGLVSNELHTKYKKGWKLIDVVMSGFFDSVGLYDEGGVQQIAQARKWLAIVGLDKDVEAYYHELSFGQQRLALLARAMVKMPRILILDEPCVGLDDFYRTLLLRLLDDIAKNTDAQLIYVSHEQEERPRCLNTRLSFISLPMGGYKIEQSSIDPG